MSVRPCYRSIALQHRIVTIPSRGPVESLGIVVITVSVAAHVQDLVLDTAGCLVVQFCDLMLEALPLSQVVVVVEVSITGIVTVDEAKVGSHKVESGRISGSFILKEIARFCGKFYVRVGRCCQACGKKASRERGPKSE